MSAALTLAALLLTVPPTIPPYAGWTPCTCGDAFVPQWQALLQEVVAAEPGSHLFVPHLFPQTDAQWIANMRHHYFEIYGDVAFDDLPAEHKPLFAGLRDNTVTYELIRVENWQQGHCSPLRPWRYYRTVRVFDRASHLELGRMALDEGGFFCYLQAVPLESGEAEVAGWRAMIPTLNTAVTEIAARYGIAVAGAQYVTVGGHLRSDPDHPSVAAHAPGNPAHQYLYGYLGFGPIDERRLWEVLPTAPSWTSRELAETEDTLVLEPDEQLVTRGYDCWTVARKVQPGTQGKSEPDATRGTRTR
jgi:hypothetical protein